MKTTIAGLALALVALMGPNAQAQKADDKDRDAGKSETVHGVIAGVTVAGETAVDFSTHRAATVEMTYLTVVGSPARWRSEASSKDNDADKSRASGERRRHNVYVLWLGPKTEVRDATAQTRRENRQEARKGDSGHMGTPATVDALEVGDHVRVTFDRRDPGTSGGGDRQQAAKHGRNRTFFGDATSIVILSEPAMNRDDNRGSNDNDRDRGSDSNKDKGSDSNKDKGSDSNKDRSKVTPRG